MMRFRTLSIVVFSLLIAGNYLVACQTATFIPEPTPTTSLVPTATPSVEAVVTHPELEVILPSNISSLEKIDQWGQGNVNGIALSPDGNLIAVSTTTGIYLYDRRTVKQVDYINIRVGENNDLETQACSTSGNLAFSPDGSTLAIASTDITLWDLKNNIARTTIKNKIEDIDSIITEIQFSTDGNSIIGIQKKASGYPCYSGWGSLVIYTIETGKIVFRHDHSRYEEGPNPIFAEKDGSLFISYFDITKKEYSVLEVNSQTGKIVDERQSPTIYSMNSNVIVRENQELTVRTLEGLTICSKPIGAESTNAFLPEIFSLDRSIAIGWNYYGNRAGDVRIWDLEQCTISAPVLIFPEVAREMSLSSDGHSLLTSSSAGYTFHVFDVQTGQMRFSLSGFDAAFNADGKQVFVIEEEFINAYDVKTGIFLSQVIKGDFDYMSEILVSPDGKFLAINETSTREYHIASISNKSVANKILISDNSNLYFNQNGKIMAAIKWKTAASSEIRFWDIRTGNELTQWQGMVPNEGYVSSSFNSDFTQLATFGTDGYYKYVYIWNVPEFSLARSLTQSFPNGNRSINNLEFVSNNQLLFAYGNNPDAFLFWDVSTGDLLSEIPVEVNGSELGNPIVFSPDGRLLAVLDGDGTVHVWGVKSP